MEQWADIAGFEGRYQISDQGRVKSLPFKQRYLLRTGVEAFRKTAERILAQQLQNSGYLIVHLHLDNKRTALCVHALVARAFVAGTGETVNHKDGVKTNNAAANLEWASYTENLLHAVALGLNVQARPVRRGVTCYPSVAQAARWSGVAPGTITRSAKTGRCDKNGHYWEFV